MTGKFSFIIIFIIVSILHISLFSIEISKKDINKDKKVKDKVFIELIEKEIPKETQKVLPRREEASPLPMIKKDIPKRIPKEIRRKEVPKVVPKVVPKEVPKEASPLPIIKKDIPKRIPKDIPRREEASPLPMIEKKYLKYIQELVRKKIKYPRRARRLKKEGTVLISINIDRFGSIKNIKIIKKSSSSILDKAAIKVFKSIVKFNAIPKELEKDSWKITIPMVYRLR